MKYTFHVIVLSILIANTGNAEMFRVIADSVNIRGNSNLTSRVMGQASNGLVVEAVAVGDAWLGIIPPADVYAWIHGDQITGGKATSRRANIRSGPGINYEAITSVTQGTELSTHGKFADWIQVTPPKGALVWISRQFTEPVQKKGIASETEASPTGSVATLTAGVGVAAKPPKPESLGSQDDPPSRGTTPKVTPAQSLSSSGVTSNMLVTTCEQGVAVSHRGVLKKASIVWRRPSRYMLVDPDRNAEDHAICYVSGNDPQLESVLGREMTIEGKQYSIQGARFPLVVTSKITVH